MESCSVCFGPEIFKAKYIMSVLKYQYTPKIDHILKKMFSTQTDFSAVFHSFKKSTKKGWEIARYIPKTSFLILMNIPLQNTILKLSEVMYFTGVGVKRPTVKRR